MQQYLSRLPASCLLAVWLALFLFTLEFLTPGFYYYDDVRHYFLPHIIDIGSRLNNGELPWITHRSWFSGNYLGDGLLSLFNPLNLALYALSARFSEASNAAFFLAATYLYLITLGVYRLARSYGLDRNYAILSALVYCTSAYQMYWNAASWWNALVGTCWMIWTWLSWRKIIHERRGYFLAFGSTFFLLVSGWPHGVFMAAVIVVIEIGFSWNSFTLPTAAGGLWQHTNWLRLAQIALLAFCAVAASLMANFPAYLHAAESERSGWGIAQGPTWVGSLDFLIAAGWPSYLSSAPTFFGNQATLPFYYLAWFVPPTLLMLFYPSIWKTVGRKVAPLLVIAATATLLTLGPEQWFVIRWPLRFLTYAHLPLTLAACIALRKIDFSARAAQRVWNLYALLGGVVSTLVSPGSWRLNIMFTGLLILTLIFFRQHSLQTSARAVWVTASCAVIMLLFHQTWPRNDNVGDWPVPSTPISTASRPTNMNSRVILIRSAQPCEEGSCLLASGNIGMWEEGRALNGYTPVGGRFFHRKLGFNQWSWSSPRFITTYFEKDPVSGKPLYELMRLNEFRIAGKQLLDRFEQVADDDWKRIELAKDKAIYHLKTDWDQNPGSLSWISPGLIVEEVEAPAPQEEVIRVLKYEGTQDSRLVFARAWYPGYEAYLDGIPLKVEKHVGILVSVVIPTRQTGTVTLHYRPAGWRWTIPLALASLVLVSIMAIQAKKRSSYFPNYCDKGSM